MTTTVLSRALPVLAAALGLRLAAPAPAAAEELESASRDELFDIIQREFGKS